MTIEVLMQALSRILAQCRLAGGPFPSHLWLQCDNCVGENKNQHWARLLATLVDRGIFRSTVASFMRPGHTHEDIDALFGILATHIAALQDWNSPEDMQTSLSPAS